jgi:hypothetical protein
MPRTIEPVISDSFARTIACQWHGDVGYHPATLKPVRVDRAVNVFASTGAILPGLASEVENIVGLASRLDYSAKERAYLGEGDAVSHAREWLRYVQANGPRPAVDGWYRLG